MLKLTARQQQVLDLVKQTMQEQGMPPTRAEIAKALGFKSANAAEDHLKALARKGAIEILPGTSRGLRLLDAASSTKVKKTAAKKTSKISSKAKPKQAPAKVITSIPTPVIPTPVAPVFAPNYQDAEFGLPVLGQVAAGSPLLAAENIDYHLAVDPHSFGKKADYLLRVKGLSMLNLGILEGDLLAVHRSHEIPKNGQLVVARIGEDVTVKRFQKQGHQVELHSANPEFEPILVDLRSEEFSIEGLAVGLIRNNLNQGLG